MNPKKNNSIKVKTHWPTPIINQKTIKKKKKKKKQPTDRSEIDIFGLNKIDASQHRHLLAMATAMRSILTFEYFPLTPSALEGI